MLPAIIVEVIDLLETAYFTYRRVLTAKRIVNDAEAVSDFLSPTVDKQLRYHKQVVGEYAYLYMLGRSIYYNHLTRLSLNEGQLDHLLMYAIAKTVRDRSSVDARSIIILFGSSLGAATQELYPETYEILSRIEQATYHGVQIKEPMVDYVTKHGLGTSPIMDNSLTILGLQGDDWATLVDVFGDPSFIAYVTAAEATYAGKGLHRTSTLLSVMIAGASRSRGHIAQPVGISEGRDGFAIQAMPMLSLSSAPIRRRPLLHDRTITSEMVSTMSRRLMMQKGFVQLGDSRNTKDWAPVDQTIIEEILDAKGISTGRYQYAIEQATHGKELKDILFTGPSLSPDAVIEELQRQAQGAVTSKAKSAAEKTVLQLKARLKSYLESSIKREANDHH